MDTVIAHGRLQALRYSSRHPEEDCVIKDAIDLMADALLAIEGRVTELEKKEEEAATSRAAAKHRAGGRAARRPRGAFSAPGKARRRPS